MGTLIIFGGNKELRDQNAIEKISAFVSFNANHPDIKIIELEEGRKNISIDQSRALIQEIFIKPVSATNKFIWIKEAQTLTTEAQNALLKVLEEPPHYAEIILTINNRRNVLPTILSRAFLHELKSVVSVNSEVYSQDFLKLLKNDIGFRLDWVGGLKDQLKEDGEMESIFNSWECVVHDLILASEGLSEFSNEYLSADLKDFVSKQSYVTEDFAEIFKNLGIYKKAALFNNVNKSLCLETFLVSL